MIKIKWHILLAIVAITLLGVWGIHLAMGAQHPAAALAEKSTLPAVIRLYIKDRPHLDAVAGRLDIWHVDYSAGYALVAARPDQIEWLQSLGYRLELEAEQTAQYQAAAPLDPRYYYFDQDYINSNNLYMLDFMRAVSNTYPALTELIDIGDTWQALNGGYQRDIWVLRITNENPAYGDIQGKPAFFLFSGIHAREVVVPELVIRYIKHLTSGYNGQGGYGLDPDVTWLVDHQVIYVLVMQNPDGHRVDEQDTTLSRRKNLDDDDGCADPARLGIDLNRNHSFKWGCCGGSSPDPCDDTFRGPERGSEPETQAFQTFFATVMRDQNGPNGDDELAPASPITTTGIFISLHTYSDLVLWPWYFTPDPAPNNSQLRAIGRKLAFYNRAVPSGDIYTADGVTDEWTYGKFGLASFTFEIGATSGACRGFFVPYDCIEGTGGMPRNFWAENKPALLYAHKIARAPYQTVFGPDADNLSVLPGASAAGAQVRLSAEIADHRYHTDTLRPIAAAEYFIDAPGPDGTGVPMQPADSAWGETSEQVTATLDTSGLELGRHYALVRGQNDLGDWGPFTAIFFYMVDPASAPSIYGNVRQAGTGAPLGATISAGPFQTYTIAASGYYSMMVLSGTYTLSASAPGHVISTVASITIQDDQRLRQDFDLAQQSYVYLPIVIK